MIVFKSPGEAGLGTRTLRQRVAISIVSLLIPAGVVAQECHPVAIVTATLTDDGDNDGFADTRETVSLRLELWNPGTTDLTGLTAELFVPVTPTTTGSPNVCISGRQIAIGDLDSGEQRTTTQSFVFHVADIDRIALYEDLSTEFEIRMAADQGTICVRGEVALDLDLDASGGGAPTIWIEGFESGLGAFENLNLDAGIPGNNETEGLSNGDGYRCQYSDPDWTNSNSYDSTHATDCFPGYDLAQADAVFWKIDGATVVDSDGGRAYTGNHSLYYGAYLFLPNALFTTPVGPIDGVGTTDPVDLGVEGSQLTIFQQVSLVDDRGLGSIPPLRSADRGVVQLQVADSAGAPVGDWVKLEPFRSGYDQQAVDNYRNCMFDPIDDGSTEDDFFNPGDPDRRLGPSSSCYPERTYACIGDTDSPFVPQPFCPADGPGLQGDLGLGTWIESVVDLSRFRGRRVRLRFVVASMKADIEWWEYAPHGDPWPVDDGWWIDDVTVTGALTSPATVTIDGNDNSGLPGIPPLDADGDTIVDACDNCPGATNTLQEDADYDGLGDVCDPCPLDETNVGEDPDADGFCSLDNCPAIHNPDQQNEDEDAFGAACDCDDDNEDVYPGAPEQHDGIDNQCPGDFGYGIVDEIENAGFHDPDNKFLFSWDYQGGIFEVVEAANATFTNGCVEVYQGYSAQVDLSGPIGPGRIRYYLVRVGFDGSWGVDSTRTERNVPCEP